MAWKDIPEKKVLATLEDRKKFKGVAAEKMTIYVDGGVPGGEGDVQGISVTVDPSTYVMTTQLKDGKGGNVGDPATVDLPLESMVVSGEYDDATKSVILTLKNGETVSFSVADLVSGLQTEITEQNPLSADLVAETANKNFVTSEEKEDISSISGLADDVETLNTNVEGLQSDVSGLSDDVDNLESDLANKQDTIDENNPLNADYIDDENSDKKLVNSDIANELETFFESDTHPAGITTDSDGRSYASGQIHSADYNDSVDISINPVDDFQNEVSISIFKDGSGQTITLKERTESLVDMLGGTYETIASIGAPAGVYNLDGRCYGKGVCFDENSGIHYSLYTEEALGMYAIAYAEDEQVGQIQIISHTTQDGIKVWVVDNGSKVLLKEYVAGEGGSGVQNTLYINPSDIYFGTLSNGINIYSDSEMTQTVHSSVIDEMLDAGDIRVKLVDSSDPSWLGENKDGVILGKYWDGDPAVFAYVMLLPFYSSDVSTTNGLTIYYMYEPNDDYKFYSFGPGLIATGTDVAYIAEGKIKEKILSGSAAPTNRTVGTKGQLYQDTSNGKVYICTNKVGSTYTWKEIIKNGDNISTLTNDAGYQNASQVSSAIATAVGQITSFEFEVVQSLPASGDAGVIYLVPNSGTTPNIYDEYIWVNNAFEKIGTTDIDLSGYATTQDLEDGLATKADAIDPTDLPSGSTQNGVITTSDHTDIDPSVVSEGQIVVDSTENKVYIVSDITTDPQTGDPVIVWKEIQTDEMVILDYGTSTWSDFLTAYNDNRIVYCRASSGSDPSVGDKTRMAFMAYITNPSNPTGVEFQYYRSVNTKSAANQTDQVVVYKLTSNGNWTVETRNTNVKIAAGTNMTSSYSGGTLTLSADLSSKQDVIDSTHKLSADLIDSSTSDDKTYQTGTGAPTTSTEGSVGEMYVDKSTGTVYVCTDTTGGTYTWSIVSGGGSGAIITMTSTDPGEGSALEENHFIAVYEV